jgi:superfamily II DNA helicase RecQ
MDPHEALRATFGFDRFRRYRAVWEYVERSQCRRVALLAHFGDRSDRAPAVACCDVCGGRSPELRAA